MYDHEKFSVIDVIVAFSGGEGFRKICARVEVTIRVFLHEYAL